MRLTPKARRVLVAGITLYVVAVLVLVFAVSCAQAQPSTPSPGPDFVAVGDGWVHKDGVPVAPRTALEACIAAQPVGATNLELLKACGQHLGVIVPGCEQVNPYTDPDLANDCTARAKAMAPPTSPVRTFTLGAIYQRPYGERKILIIGKALGIDGVEVITAQVVHPASEKGTPIAFLNDGGVTAGQWWPAINGGGR